jgi:hypothetical protein
MGRPGPQGHRHRCGARVLVHTLADENGAENPPRIYLESNFLRVRDFGRDYTGDSRNLCTNVNVCLTIYFLYLFEGDKGKPKNPSHDPPQLTN